MKKVLSCVLSACLIVAMLASCATAEAPTELTGAKDYLFALYKDSAVVTASDYQVVGVVARNGVTYNVEWTVNNDSVKLVPADKMVTVDVDEKTPVDIDYTLTATVSDEKGNALTVSFDHKVPAFKELSWKEYIDAAKDSTVVVKGVVTGLMAKSKGNSYNCIYMQDADGGYYVYGMADDPVELGVGIGNTVRVTGAKDLYSGTHEIKNATVEILDKGTTMPAAADFTAKYQAAASLKDEDLTAQQALLVTIKDVEITGEDASNGYYKFKLGNLESYVRISSSVCPINKDEQASFKAAHAEHLGWIADATGVICVYDGAFYLTPVTEDSIVYKSMAAKSDAEMVAFEKENIALEKTSFSADGTMTLPLYGKAFDQVNIFWFSSDNAHASIKGDTLTVTMPEADETITLKALIISGDVVEEVTYDVKLLVREMSYAEIVEAAYALEEGAALDGTYRLYGVVTEIPTVYSEQYGNITVNIAVPGMEDKIIQCYRLQGEGCADLAVGDAITVEGALKNYKGTVEFDAKCVLIGKGEILNQAKAVAQAYALEAGEAMSAPTILKGVVTEIPTAYSEQYGNITVNFAPEGAEDQIIQAYRLSGEGAASIQVGDTIAVFGTIKNYKGTIEFDTGCKLIPADHVSGIKAVLAAYALENKASLAGKYTVTGKVTSIATAYDEKYGNISVWMECDGLADYPIEAYRLAGGSDIAEGDVITVTGALTRYNTTYEFAAGCTYTK